MRKLALILLLTLSACATRDVNSNGLDLMTEAEYEKIITKYTDRIETYNGLYNTLQASATLVNSKVATAQLDQNARLYQWDQAKFNNERTTTMDKISKETEVFLSFYTPEKKHDDLNKSNSMWKIFLDAGGRRHEGKVTKIKLQTVEVQGLYPNHNRFSTPYIVTFPISVRYIENQPAKLILTGPVGSATLNFIALENQ